MAKNKEGATIVDQYTGLVFNVENKYIKDGDIWYKVKFEDSKYDNVTLELKDNQNFMVFDKELNIANGEVEAWLKNGDDSHYLDALASSIYDPSGEKTVSLKSIFTKDYINKDGTRETLHIGERYASAKNEISKLDSILKAKYPDKLGSTEKCMTERVAGLNRIFTKYDLGRDVLVFKNFELTKDYGEAVSLTDSELKENDAIGEKVRSELKIGTIKEEMEAHKAKTHLGSSVGGLALAVAGVGATLFGGGLFTVVLSAIGVSKFIKGFLKTYSSALEKNYYKNLKLELKNEIKKYEAFGRELENVNKEIESLEKDNKALDKDLTRQNARLEKLEDKTTKKANDIGKDIEKIKNKQKVNNERLQTLTERRNVLSGALEGNAYKKALENATSLEKILDSDKKDEDEEEKKPKEEETFKTPKREADKVSKNPKDVSAPLEESKKGESNPSGLNEAPIAPKEEILAEPKSNNKKAETPNDNKGTESSKSNKVELTKLKIEHREKVFAQKLENKSTENENICNVEAKDGIILISEIAPSPESTTQLNDKVTPDYKIEASNSNKPEKLDKITYNNEKASSSIEMTFSKDVLDNRKNLVGDSVADMIGNQASKADKEGNPTNSLLEIKCIDKDGNEKTYSKNDSDKFELPEDVASLIEQALGDGYENIAKSDIEIVNDTPEVNDKKVENLEDEDKKSKEDKNPEKIEKGSQVETKPLEDDNPVDNVEN